jgi:phosphopantothenoylcysteine decarboxylase/phosphopantothenate--cysteine ligase
MTENYSTPLIPTENSWVNSLTLIKNPDIISEVAHLPKAVRPFTVGFAAEVDALKAHGHQKRQVKKLDMIIVNQIGQDDRGFDSDDNAALVLWAEGEKNLPLQSKKQLAKKILHCVFLAIKADKIADLSNKTS